MHLISKSVSSITGKVLTKKHTMLGRIIYHWDELVGDDVASKAVPIKLNYRQVRGKNKQFVLTIGANSSVATLLSYRIDLILQRLNRIFGEEIITAIRFEPHVSNDSVIRKGKKKKQLNQQDKDFISSVIHDIEDTDLKESLKDLGKSILEDPN
jgi:hypothetical protein